MRQSGRALRWIVNILGERSWEGSRPGHTAHIDIYVPDRHMDTVINKTRKFIVFGPERVREKNWDLEFIKIMYAGQLIEIGSPEKTKIYDNVKKRWFIERIDFSKSRDMEAMGVRISVMPKRQLISRKKRLGRDVDETDLKQMRHPKARRP